jgi:NAD(P)-dependent dehydrogenase (short-subunit alcohol dehydrogenase family)
LPAQSNTLAVLITGVSPGGLGAEAAFSIAAQKPGLIILASRDVSKIAETAAAIEERHPGTPTRILKLDLASFAAIREAAKEVNAYTENIDVLINNAAVMACPYATTADGFEMQFGTNHLGHFLFTVLILGKLTKGTGRVVNVSSIGHRRSPIRFGDFNFSDGETYDRWEAYGQSKTANILFSVELAKRGVNAFSLHPGGRVPLERA